MHQAEQIEAERAAKRKKKRLAREAQEALPTKRHYTSVESYGHMSTSLTTSEKNREEGVSVLVPQRLRPHTVIYIPHKLGFLTLHLEDCSSIVNKSFLDAIFSFLDKHVQRKSRKCKNIRFDIYRQPSLYHLRKLLITEFELYVQQRNEKMKALQTFIQEFNLELTTEDGILSVELPLLSDTDTINAALKATKMLQETKSTLTPREVEKGISMINSLRLMSKTTSKPEPSSSSTQLSLMHEKIIPE